MEQPRKNRFWYFIAAYVGFFAALAVFGVAFVNQRVTVRGVNNALTPRPIVTDMAYIDLPRITVSVNNGNDNAAPRLRADILLEVARQDRLIVEGYQPRITEKLNMLLSNLDTADIQRDSSLTQLRADMLKAVNDAGLPVPVHALLFRELVFM